MRTISGRINRVVRWWILILAPGMVGRTSFVAFADSCGVNTSSVAYFKLLMGNRVWALVGWYQPAPARHWARTNWGLPGSRIREIQVSGLSSRTQVPCPGKGSRSSLSLRCRWVSECRHPEGRWRMWEKGKRWGRRLCAGARSAARGC